MRDRDAGGNPAGIAPVAGTRESVRGQWPPEPDLAPEQQAALGAGLGRMLGEVRNRPTDQDAIAKAIPERRGRVGRMMSRLGMAPVPPQRGQTPDWGLRTRHRAVDPGRGGRWRVGAEAGGAEEGGAGAGSRVAPNRTALRGLKPRSPARRHYQALRPDGPAEPTRTTPLERPDRCCPECDHKGYLFRARRTVDGEPGAGKFVETKYRCPSCSHEWWERIPAPPEVRRPETGDAA